MHPEQGHSASQASHRIHPRLGMGGTFHRAARETSYSCPQVLWSDACLFAVGRLRVAAQYRLVLPSCFNREDRTWQLSGRTSAVCRVCLVRVTKSCRSRCLQVGLEVVQHARSFHRTSWRVGVAALASSCAGGDSNERQGASDRRIRQAGGHRRGRGGDGRRRRRRRSRTQGQRRSRDGGAARR